MTSIDGDLLDELADILRGRGRSDAITSAELSARLNLDAGEASPKAREAVGILRVERGLPVRSGNVGYWVCQSEEEAEEYLANLQGRIAGIEETMREFDEAWENYEPRAESQDEPDLPDDLRQRVEDDPTLSLSDIEDHFGVSVK